MFKDETGHVYGTWKVVQLAGPSTTTNGSEWSCECAKCGSSKLIRGANLRRQRLPKCDNCCYTCGKTRQEVAFRGGKYICIQCNNARIRGWKDGNDEHKRKQTQWYLRNSAKKKLYNERRRVKVQESPYSFLDVLIEPRRRLYKSLSVLTDTRAQQKSKRPDRFAVQIDSNFLCKLWDNQSGLCAITNVPMTHRFGDLRSVSIDRIDSEKGYVEDNVQLVCRWVNLAKGQFSNDDIKKVLAEFKYET